MQLSVADVDRIDASCATFDQHLGKAAGRGADVEADTIVWIELELPERRGKLDTPARDVGMYCVCIQHGTLRDFLRGLAHRPLVGGHKPSLDGGLRPGATFKEAALDQQAVGTLTRYSHGLSPLAGRRTHDGTKIFKRCLQIRGARHEETQQGHAQKRSQRSEGDESPAGDCDWAFRGAQERKESAAPEALKILGALDGRLCRILAK